MQLLSFLMRIESVRTFRNCPRPAAPTKKSRLIRNAWVLGCALGLLGSGFAIPSAKGDVFAFIGEGNGRFDRLDITTGAVSVIGNGGSAYFGLAYNANESVLYGLTGALIGGPSSLVTVDPTTGASTLVGANGVPLVTITSLANGNLYGVGINNSLYQINQNTGAATLVGATGLAPLGTFGWENSFASDGTSLYYTLGTTGNDQLYTLSTSTGAAALIGSTGVTGIVGSVFAGPTFLSGNLYGFRTNGQTDVINTTTGAATFLNNNGVTDIFGGVGVVTSATAPLPTVARLGMPIFCVLGMTRLIRRSRSRALPKQI